ncbi:MAG: fibronectin type III domain-containing protein [Candidatus Kerfeldbacteria bacterium]
MKFPLTDLYVPSGATITKVELKVNVTTNFAGDSISIYTTSDNIQTESCNTGALFNDLDQGVGSPSDWNTTGLKTVVLDSNAINAVQAKITTSEVIGLAVSASGGEVGYFTSTDSSSNKPILKVTYTMLPQAPTAATPNHSANSTSTITWNWVDHATEDSAGSNSQRIMDGTNVKCSTTGDMATTGATMSCQETSLSANTAYTRKSNTVDPQGNTDGPNMTAYTSIETPSGISFSNVTTTGITTTATGTISNLTSDSSGLYFQESVTSTNSDWTQTNSWAKSGLTANTQYSFQVKARNGNSDETSLTAATTKYTLSVTPSAASTRVTSAWYTSGTFPFTNPVGWGAGGIQYYRYAWDTSPIYAFAGTESTWSSLDANCPGGTCTDAGTTLSKTATTKSDLWYLHLQSFNAEGIANGSGSSFGPYYYDGSAPVFSSFSATPTTNGATLSWTTDEPTTTQLEYGTTISYGTNTALDATLATSHTVTLSGLAAGTAFHARVLGTDEAGNTGQSSDLSFTTTSAAQTLITNVQVSSISPTSVVITWTTNEPATSKVRYGTSTDYGLEVSDNALVTSHSLTITGLTPGTTYHYEVISVGSTTDHDADATFTTSASAPITTLSAVRAVVGETIATVYWTTNEAATSMVHYGTTTDYTGAKSSTEKTASHRIQLTGLTPGTLYHYMVVSVGSTADSSRDFTFTTGTPESTTNRAIGPTIFGTVLHDGESPTIDLNGIAKGDQTLTVYVDGKKVKTIKTAGSSSKTQSFSVAVPLGKLSKGKHTLYVQSTDAEGRTSRVVQRITFTIGVSEHGVLPVRVKGAPTSYIVVKGDSLWKIAERYLGNGALYTTLIEANKKAYPSIVTNPSVIQPGWKLMIPSK